MKTLDAKYVLMVVFTLFVNIGRVFANLICNLDRETW